MIRLLAAILVLGLAACSSAPRKPDPSPTADAAQGAGAGQARRSPYPPAQEDLSKRGDYTAGGLYAPHISDTAPDIDIQVDLIPEPEVVAEPRSRYGNRPTYTVLGKDYKVLDDPAGFVEQGIASYYGTKFHGRRTSNMEVYDMYAFTAAHKHLPLPSFARVTNLDNGRSVVVRVNDRGPFHEGRVIDLSYAAAVKLGIHPSGTGRVEVRALVPDDLGPSPAPADTRVAAVQAAPADSPMDGLVAALPASALAATDGPVPDVVPAPATVAGPAAEAPARHYRYDVDAAAAAGDAERFEQWMHERQVRVATGRPGTPGASAAPAGATTGVSSSPPSATPPPAAPASDGVVLQVASFSARSNADRALEALLGAGIDGARIHDAVAGGRQVWRLRVGPVRADTVATLAPRIVALGFGEPQPVRD